MAHSNRTFYFLYSVCLLVLGIVLLEISSFVFLKAKDQGANTTTGSRHLYHPYRSHQLNPDYVRTIDTAGKKIHSEDGFRSDVNYQKDKPDGIVRILMMGGSALYGIGAEPPYKREPTLQNNETISYFLEQKLNGELGSSGSKKKVEVINAAVTAYTTFHHLVYLNEVLYEYSPDLVVFLDGHNDFYYYETYNHWQDFELGTGRLTEHFNYRDFWFTSLTVVRFLAQYSRFFMVLEKYLQRDWKQLPEPRFIQSSYPRTRQTDFPTSLDSVLKESIFKSYVQIEALSKLFGFNTLVLLQPQLVLEAPEKLSNADLQLQKFTMEIDTNTRRADAREYFPDLFDQYNIRFEDISEIATDESKNTQLYYDYCHLSPAGSELAATRMFPDVYKMVQERIALQSRDI